MTKILTTDQIRQLDQYTIENEPVTSIDLMERASRAFVQWVTENISLEKKIGIVCGTGNNGGDGLAIARMLIEWGYDVKVWVVKGGVKETDDYLTNFKRLTSKTQAYEIKSSADQNLFSDREVLVDAIFGSGISRPAEGLYAQVINCINNTNATRIAVDIPSGLLVDKTTEGPVVKADYTITFQLPKLAFFLPQSRKFTGEWVVVNIGLSRQFIRQSESSFRYVLKKDACKLLKKRSKFDHKGTYGHALLVAGSYGKMGAAVLAARAVLRAGVGLLTVHAPRSGMVVMQTACPEAMFLADADEKLVSEIPSADKFDVIGVGPGLGQDPRTAGMIEKLLEQSTSGFVIDADALNILGANKQLLKKIPKGSILTPHPKEFERLTCKWDDDFERLDIQRQLATTLQSVVVLKGAFTSIAMPDGKVYFNSTGNPGMATGGTGDVLTGILTGLLAQSYSAKEAAILGVYLHGLSGDHAAAEKGEESLIASDIIDFLPAAFRSLKG